MGILAENLKEMKKGLRIHLLKVVVRDLLEAEEYEKLYKLLTDADFREIKSKELGVTDVAADYRLALESGCFDDDPSKQDSLQQIYEELLSSPG